MDYQAIAAQVKKYAPLLGSVIGGPAGGAVGAGISGLLSLIGGKFGMTADEVAAAPAELASRISIDPDADIKLAEIQSAKEVELARLKAEQERMYLEDRQSARAADVEKTKATGERDANLYVLAWVVVGGFFLLMGVLLFRAIPPGSSEAVYMLFGALIAGFKDVLGYFFGSSKSSSEKTKMLAGKAAP